MHITPGFKKLMPSILSGAIGIALGIYGINAGNPRLQILGLFIFIVSMVVMVRTRQRIACEIKPQTPNL